MEMSTNIAPRLKSHYDWTRNNFADADRSSSLLQVEVPQEYAKHVADDAIPLGRLSGCPSEPMTVNLREVRVGLPCSAAFSTQSIGSS